MQPCPAKREIWIGGIMLSIFLLILSAGVVGLGRTLGNPQFMAEQNQVSGK